MTLGELSLMIVFSDFSFISYDFFALLYHEDLHDVCNISLKTRVYI